MKGFLLKHNWWFYIILTFALSWSIWSLGHKLLPEGLRTVTLILGVFGPFASALIIIAISKGRPALKEWLRNIFNFRIHITWYIMGGIAMPFLLAAIHHIIYLVLGGQSGMEISTEWFLYFAYMIPTALLSGGNDQPIVWLVIYCIPLSMILTWLYYRSKRSIIPAMLFHGGSNVVFRYFPMNTSVRLCGRRVHRNKNKFVLAYCRHSVDRHKRYIGI